VKGQTAVYHCMTRVVGGEGLLDDVEKEVLRKQLWKVADFCGVEVLTYCVMSNHFHVLVRVREVRQVFYWQRSGCFLISAIRLCS